MSYTINRQYMVTECCYNTKPNVQYVVIHYTGNYADNARSNAIYFYNNQSSVQGSAHFFVDSGSVVYASVSEQKSAWHVGDGRGSYGLTNYNSLGIEMATSGAYMVSSATENVAAQLAADLLKKYGLGINSLKRHYDASRKDCPRGWNNASPYASQAGGEQRWLNFKAKVQKYLNGGGGGSTTTELFRVFDANNKQVSSWKNKNSALNAAKSIKGYVKSSVSGQIVADYRSSASVEVFRVFSANNEQKAAFKNKDSAIQQAKSIKGYVKSSVTNQIVADYRSSAAPTGGYRVKDANGKQLGYFANLANAKALCDKNPGSKVYDSNNNVIHSNSKNTLYVNLYPVRSSWNVYPTDKAPVSGNQCGSLNPLAYGGLSYEVLKNVGNDVYHIRTQNYGLVSIYVPNDNEGCVSTTKMY